jgi:hypothetical protein
MISKEKIFSLFDSPNTMDVHEDFMDNPYTKIGMFNKIIINNKIFLQKLKFSLDKVKKVYSEESINEYTAFVTFNRAFFYINQVDINNNIHIDALMCYNPEQLIYNLEQSILYFEKNEEYEKCAHLFKIKNFLEEFEKSLDSIRDSI